MAEKRNETGVNGWRLGAIVLMLGGLMAVTGPALAADDDNAVSEAQEAKNKELVLNFYNMIFNEHKVEEAFEKYTDPRYIQHNPMAPSGANAAIKFLKPFLEKNPGYSSDVKRALADGDLVMLHSHVTMGPDDRGSAVVDIFRVEDGKVVEHWDVIQSVPEKIVGEEPMF